MSFFAELKRRNVFRVAAAYVVVGWLTIEVASVLAPALNLPGWATSLVAFFVILGFPLALILSWAYELTPEGMKKTESVPLSQSVTRMTGRKLDFIIIAVLATAVGFFLIERSMLDTSGPFAGAEIDPRSLDPEPQGAPAAGAGLMSDTPVSADEGDSDVLPDSVAVLVCDNLSPDPDDAYFAASIHEEILSQLAKIRALNVIARTSVLQYAESPPPISQIARELNVQSVMECSVRYAGDAVLVTAQLVDPDTNSQIWSGNYPGDLSDLGSLFAMQADIAMNIANALQTEFSIEEQENLERIPTQSRDAYVHYLRARNDTLSSSDVQILLDQAIELDPNFARAYAIRAYELAFGLVLSDADQAQELERLLRENAEKAIEIDPSLGIAHAALAVLHYVHWRGAEADQAFRRAVQLNPNDVDVLIMYGRFKRYRDDRDESVRLLQKAVELDPNGLRARNQLALTYRRSGDFDGAAALFNYAIDRGQTQTFLVLGLAETEALRGNGAEAIRNLEFVERRENSIPAFRLVQMAHTYALAGRQDDALRLITEVQQRSGPGSLSNADRARANLVIGEYEEALRQLRAAVENRVPTDLVALTTLAANPWNDPILERPEFRSLLDALWMD